MADGIESLQVLHALFYSLEQIILYPTDYDGTLCPGLSSLCTVRCHESSWYWWGHSHSLTI